VIGKLLGNRYEIVRKLGSGGMAHVYKANCTYLHRPVSVKVLRPEHAEDEDFLRRFEREAQAAASLSHPNIVGVYDVGSEGETHYIVMEYINGESLKDLIRRRGKLPIAEALNITVQILRALEHAHENGVIHRDIKPHNILITPDGHVRVGDFGLAKATGGATLVHSGAVVGSAHYFSPEQARGGYTNERSDLYSVGVVLYEMVTGQVPFDGETPVSVAVKHLQESPTPPSEVNPEISAELEWVILKALAKKQVDRYQSAGDMLHDVQALQQGEPINMGREPIYETQVISKVKRPENADEKSGDPNLTPRRSERKSHDRRPRRLRPWVRRGVWAAVILLLIGGAVFAAYQISNWLNVPTVTVPNVVGKEFSEASEILRGEGLNPEIVGNTFSDEVPAGYVIRQKPEGGSVVKAGRTIELTNSLGPEWVEGGVPDVKGRSRRAATIELQEVGLDWEIVEEYSSEVAEGYVVSQNPRAGTRVQKNTVVQLVVSLGPEPVALTVPELVGVPVSEALATLEDLGLERGEVSHSKGIYPADYVLSQRPGPGATIQTGEEVDLVVSLGCQKSRDIPIRTASAASSPFTLKVRLTDVVSTRIVYNEEHERGEIVTVPLCWAGGAARIEVLFDDVVVAEDTVQ